MKRTKVLGLAGLFFLIAILTIVLWNEIPNLIKTIKDESSFIQGLEAFGQLALWAIIAVYTILKFISTFFNRPQDDAKTEAQRKKKKKEKKPSTTFKAKSKSGQINQGNKNKILNINMNHPKEKRK